ncbi:MAG: tetratricopeptide repeat protein [Deltaproteobacteria bacterium]|nr:tetratricopeptide repeat protein [Deltaproteobacteria bacterium]
MEAPSVSFEIHEDVDDATAALFAEAATTAAESSERGVEAWRKVAQRHRKLRTPKRHLAKLYEDLERWNQLVDVLKDEKELVTDPVEKKTMLRQMVGLYRDQLRLDVMVVNTLTELHKLDPQDVAVLDEMIVQYETMSRWRDLISTLKRKVEVCDDAEQVEIWARIATLFADRFSNQAEAIKAYERIIEIDPTHREAMTQLRAMYERRRDWDKLIAVAKKEIDLLETDEERAVAYLEVAQLASTKVKRPQISTELWEKVIEFDPQNLEGLSHLETLYERAKDWEKLADVCEKQVELTDDPTHKAKTLQKLGILFSDKAADDERAIVAWRALLDIEPTNRRAQDALKKLYLAARAYDDLEEFYASQGKYDEFIRVLERQVDSEDPERRLELYFKIAELWQVQLEKPDRASRAYEKILSLDESNLRAAEALIPIYEGGRDVKKYVHVLEIQLSHTEEPTLALERLRALAELSEQRLRDKEGAFAWYIRAFEVDSRAEWIREEAERLAGDVGKWPDLVTAYEASYERLADPIDQLPIMLTVARVFEEELANTDEALRTNKNIIEIESQNEQAIGALERLYTATKQWKELLDIYRRKIEIVVDGDERKEIYFRIAYLYEEEIDDPERAIEAYNTILDIDADESRAMRSLETIYERLERWAEFAETLQRELSLVSSDDLEATIDLKYRLGQLRETYLEDVSGAIDAYRDILEIKTDHEGARLALESRLTDETFQLDASSILEPIYTELEAWQQLVQVYEIQLSRQEDMMSKVDLLSRIGALWVDRIGDGEQAFDAYSRCFKLEPTNEMARSELERLAAIGERWEDISALYEEATSEALDAPLQQELLLKLAAMMEERLERSDRAIEFYRRAQELEPEHAPTLDALERLYQKGEQWNELLDVYRRKADISLDGKEREGLFFKMAYIWEEMLANLAEAVSCYNEVLAQEDGNPEALRALDRLYLAQSAWHELADNLTRQLILAEMDAEKVEILGRLAKLRETELGETAAAVDTYRQVLDLDPVNEGAVHALEGLISNEEYQISVAQILEPYYKGAADWERLIGVYEIMVNHAFDPARKIELLERIAELYEVAGEDQTSAFGVFGRALREDPAHEATQANLERLARSLEVWEQLVALYNELVADVMDEMLAVALHMKVAHIWEIELANLGEAAEAYKRILALDVQNLPAVDALEQIYLRSEQYPELVAILLKKAEILLDAEERKSLFFRAAQINEEILEAFEEAISVYAMVLDIDDSDPQAIDALERLYFRLERWDDLKDIYMRKAELTVEVDGKKAIFYNLGRLYVERLEDIERGIETFQNVVDLDPEDVTAIQSLDALFQRAERWYDLLQILERQVELAGNSPQGVDLKHRIGKLWENELGDLTRAVETYRDVLLTDPGHESTLDALDAIVHGDEEPVVAAQVLEPVYEQSLEWAKLIDLLEVMNRHSDYRKLELLHRIAELYELRLEDSPHAFEAFGRALQEESSDEKSLVNLERLAADINGWETLSQLYEQELEKLLDPDRQVEMGLRVARVYEEELGQAERAIEHFKQVLEAELDNRAAILSLDRLYLERGQWVELVEILRREIRMADTEQDIIDLQFRLSQVYQEELKDLPNAIECYREILASTPEHSSSVMALELLFGDGQHQLEISEILEPLYRVGEQWEKLVKIMEVQLERQEDAFEKVQGIQRIAEICEQRLGDHERAFRWWGYALQFDPMAELITEELERLARTVDAWEELAGFYQAVLEGLEDDDKCRMLKMTARVYDEELRDRGRSEETYLRVLQIETIDNDALEALDRIYTQASMFQELAEILKRRIAITDGTDELVVLQLRLGETYETALEEYDHAVTTYIEVLEGDSRNAKALNSLEQIYFQRMEWPELSDVYEKMIDIAPGDAGVADCYARMAKISSDALEDAPRAQDLWSRVLDLRGEDPVALWALADLYETAEEWRELVEVLERQVHITEEAHAQIRLYQRLGRIWGEKLGRERNALESWQKVLEIDPGDLMALYAMARIYQETQAWDELGGTLHRLIDIGITSDMPDEDLKALYIQLGSLEGEILLRPQEAVEAWRKVLDLQPDSFQALGALEQLLTQEARWEECVAVLEKKVAVLQDDQEKIDVLLQAANIWQEKVENSNEAGSVYERILSFDPAHRVAFTELNKIYREGWHWEKLVDLLLARHELTEEVSEKVELLQEVAKIYEAHLSQPEGAFMVLQVAFELDYSNDVTVKELERLASVTGQWNELLTKCNTVVQTIPDPKAKSNLLVNMGIWYGSELARLDYAVASVQQALQIDPENKRALAALADFYRKTGQWTELVQVIHRHQELEEDAPKRTELLSAMAEVFEVQLADQAQAINAYRKATEIDDTNGDVLDALERLYRNNENWEGLISILARKSELAEEMDDRIRFYTQIGDLYEDQLQRLQDAVGAQKEVLTFDPMHLPALRSLERLYEKTGQYEDYLDVLDQQLDIATADDERISLYERQTVVWEEQFNKLDRAAECLEKILLINPNHVATYRSLERIYQTDSRFEDLVESYRRHINAINDPSDRVAIYLLMGQTYEVALRDPDRSIEAYTDILSFDPDHTQALDALARLYEDIEAWDRAVDVMNRLVQLVDDAAYRVNVFYRLGHIHEEHQEDPETAEERYSQALELDPSHVESMMQLVEIYKNRGDWAKAAQLMIRAEEHSTNALEKTRLLYEAGMAFLNELGDESTAAELLGRTLAIDPDHEEAGEPLAHIYFRDGRYEEVEIVLDMLIRKADRRDNHRLQDLYYKLGKTCDVLGKSDKALKYYRAAYDIDSTHLPTLLGMADLLHRMEDWDRAFKIYQTILVHHRDSQGSEEIVEIFYRLGNIKLKLGERKKALNMFEKALEINSYHRSTLEAIVDLQVKQNDWEAVVQAKRALLETADVDEKFEIYQELGEIFREKVRSPERAVESFGAAADLKPESHAVLHKLIELFSETEQWHRAVEIVERLADMESNGRIKARYLYSAAVINRDKMKDLDESLRFFNASLDHQLSTIDASTEVKPEDLKAFEAMDRICTQRKDWKTQDRNYRKMIKRLSPDGQTELKIMLWHALGEIYRSRLRDFPSAIAAFEMAAELQPEMMQRHEILAELYVIAGPDYSEKAILEHQTLIKNSPFKIDSYQALRRIYMENNQYDKAWCLCSTLSFLKKADAEEQQFYEQYKQRGFVRAKARMTDEIWHRDLFHPDEDPYIGTIFSAIAPVVGEMTAQVHKKFGLKRKERRDLATDQALFSKVFNYVTSVLNVVQADVYFKQQSPTGLQMAHTTEIPSFVVGADLLRGRPEKELGFAIAKELSNLRPEHFLRRVLPAASQLRTVFFAALKMSNSEFPVPPADMGEVEKILKYVRDRMHMGQLEQLAGVVKRFIEGRGEVNLNKWLMGVEWTANRVGFVLCNDLEVAAKMVSTEPASVGGLPPKEKVKELVLYSVSEEYFRVRAELGLTIG